MSDKLIITKPCDKAANTGQKESERNVAGAYRECHKTEADAGRA